MRGTNVQFASEVVSTLLKGAQLDTIRVYSLIVQLGFLRIGGAENVPGEVWLSVSGNLTIEDESSTVGKVNPAIDFFSSRERAISESYRLIGKEVAATTVSDSGFLEVHLGSKLLRVEADTDGDLEDIWSVTDGLPDPNSVHQWHVSLDDSGCLSVRAPS